MWQNLLHLVNQSCDNSDDIFTFLVQDHDHCSTRTDVIADDGQHRPSKSSKPEWRELTIHKNLLKAHSMFFHTMFNSDHWKECQTNRMELNDIDYRLLKKLIDFLTIIDTKIDSIEQAWDLYKLGHRFQVAHVKMAAGEFILNENLGGAVDDGRLSILLDLYIESEKYRLKSILPKVLFEILTNVDNLVDAVDFDLLTKGQLKLLVEVYSSTNCFSRKCRFCRRNFHHCQCRPNFDCEQSELNQIQTAINGIVHKYCEQR